MAINRQVSYEEWEALKDAEAPIYKGEYGAHAYTSVNERRDGDHTLLVQMWEHAALQVWDDLDPQELVEETARRTAAAMAILAFGVEFGSELVAKAAKA